MTSQTQKTIGKIFLQVTIALTAFAALSGLAKADTKVPPLTVTTVIDQQLFDTKGARDLKNYEASQQPFTAEELEFVNKLDLNTLIFSDETTHFYTEGFRFGKSDANRNWPLLSLNIQEGDINVKIGSKYDR
jgi:hypothetical protein